MGRPSRSLGGGADRDICEFFVSICRRKGDIVEEISYHEKQYEDVESGRRKMKQDGSKTKIKKIFIAAGLVCAILSFLVVFFVPGAKSTDEPLSTGQITVMFSLLGGGIGLMLAGAFIGDYKGRAAGAKRSRGKKRLILGGAVAVAALIVVLIVFGGGGRQSAVISAAAPAAFGEGVLSAGAYQPEESGPHRVVILSGAGKAYADWLEEDWNSRLPSDWVPESAGDIELVAVLSPERKEYLGSRPYTGLDEIVDFAAYAFAIDIALKEARTGKTVATTTLSGSVPSFDFVEYQVPGQEPHIDGEHIAYSSLEEWLCPYVSPQEDWTPVRTLDGTSGF